MRPPRYKFALINWIAVYPLITLILWATQPVIGHLPLYVVTLIASLILAVLMNFLVMPLMLRLFARWLSPSVRLASHEPLHEVPEPPQ